MAVALGIPFPHFGAAAAQQIRDITPCRFCQSLGRKRFGFGDEYFWKDIGDIIFPPEKTLSVIKDTIGDILKHGAKTLSLGYIIPLPIPLFKHLLSSTHVCLFYT